MTAEDRERLVEAMARRAHHSIYNGVVPWDSPNLSDLIRQLHRITARAGLDAIEAAGFTIVPPDDGR